jgi:protein-tyrosine phosphatase
MRAKLFSIQTSLPGRLSTMARPHSGDWLSDEITALHDAGVDILVSLLTPDEVDELDLSEEAACCHNQGIFYLSFPIPDLTTPPFSPQTFTFLEQLHTSLSQGKHLAIHCRMGIGRSSLIAASLLVLQGLSPDHAFDLITAARGHTVPDTPEQRAWVEHYAVLVNKW